MSKIRISPSFNLNNVEHKKAIDFIEKNGRNKANYIAKAVLFYENNKNCLQEKFKFVTRDEVIEIIESRVSEVKYSEPSESCSLEINEEDKNSLLSSLDYFK